MRYIIGMAIRNVRRNTRRSILAVISVTLAVAFIVTLQGMMGGFMSSLVKNYTKNETGHVRISTTAFADKARFYPVTENLENPDSLISALQEDPEIAKHIRLVTERAYFGVLLSHDGKNKTAVALAGDPQTEKNLLLLQKSILPGGRYIQGERETIIGSRIADALDYGVGDTLKVMTQGSDYALHLRKFAIVGVFRTGLKSLDDAVFQIPLADAKRLLRMGDEAQQIMVMLDDHRQADKVAATIAAKLDDPDLTVYSWLNSEYGQWMQMAESIYSLFYAALALFGSFIIGNIMMMVVLERRHEIGVLKSMGLSKRSILALFVSEGTMLGLVGSIAGVIFGALVCTYYHLNPMDYFASAMETVEFPFDSTIRFAVDPLGWLQALVLGTSVAAMLSLLPSWRAARMNPVESIKSL
ncbi:MAG: FtsX-like permease family protein [Chitinivibrionales bacterium]|nr:FtsX-like permease family protein [Chitinivibrionales bacterium]